MKYDPARHHRRSIRLRGYDYTQAGAYFITICTQGREYLFGEVADDEMHLNEYGRIVRDVWFDLPNHVSNVVLDAFVVMPNHVHGIVVIANGDVVGVGVDGTDSVGADSVGADSVGAGSVGAGSVGAGSEPA
ncbi:MAG: transposase, partial [Meiothermus sp.]